MNALRVRELTRMEVRRSAFLLGRLYLLGVVGLAFFFLIGKATNENILAVVMGVTLGASSVTPFAVMRDKLDRTLEFLLSLPVSVADLVTARFVAAAVGLVPGAVATGVAFALVAPPAEFGPLAALAPFQMALGFWVLLTFAAWVLIAAAACELSGLVGWSVAALLVVGFVVPRVVDLLDQTHAMAVLGSFLQQPYAVVAIGIVAAAVMVAVSMAAFAVARRYFAGYLSRPDKPL